MGRRLSAAFILVALASVVVLTAAALVGTDRGLVAAQRQDRQRAADRAAALAGAAYTAAGGWQGADLAPASAVAEAAGARLVVLDTDQAAVRPRQTGQGQGHGGPGQGNAGQGNAGQGNAGQGNAGQGNAGQGNAGMGRGALHPAAATVPAPVVVAGETVGSVRLLFAAAETGGRGVAWSWVAGAAVVALITALAASWFVSRWLANPLVHLARTARRFAAGERQARARLDAPGELGEVARAFDAMADEVARTEAIRRSLAADVAHELRTPLAGLQAGLEELRDGLTEADPGRLGALHDQALRLCRVVGDLAELSAAESAAMSLQPSDADLSEVVRAAVAGQLPLLRAAGLTVTVEPEPPRPVPVRVDRDRIGQAVTNLLANAGRYCRPGDRVSVRTTGLDGAGHIEVADTGPGIPAEDLPHVFERLWRGRDSQRVAGSGIGLAVVRELVAAHGGTVSARPNHPRGVSFVIDLPARAPAAADRAPERSPGRDQSRGREQEDQPEPR